MGKHIVVYYTRSRTGIDAGAIRNVVAGEMGASSRSTLEGYLNSVPSCMAFLDTIAWAEGGRSYQTLYGGGTFSGWQHPNRRITAGGYTSTAAGRYQFLYSTWSGIARRLGLSDFSPRNQDIAALALIEERGQLSRLLNGDAEGVMRGLGCAWAALPFNGRKCRPAQRERDLGATLNYYRSALAVYAGAAGATTTTPPPAQTLYPDPFAQWMWPANNSGVDPHAQCDDPNQPHSQCARPPGGGSSQNAGLAVGGILLLALLL